MSDDPQPCVVAVPVRLSYAGRPPVRWHDRLVTAFVVVAVAVVLGSGSLAWVLMMRHR